MADERFVVLGLARARTPWFRALSTWSTEAIAPVDFIKCLTVEEVRSRLDGHRRFSALFVDAGSAPVDRDLFERSAAAKCPVIVVGRSARAERWQALGASAVLPLDFDRAALLDTLQRHCLSIQDVPDIDRRPAPPGDSTESPGYRAPLVAVTGGGGCGSSTIAAALAQGWADDARLGGRVALVDFARRADQAMLHHVGDVVPGVQELVEAHRHGQPRGDQIRSHLFSIVDRRYDLLLGLRRPRDWTTLRPAATTAAIRSLRQAYEQVIADVTAEVEGQETTGSVDIEDRHLLSRLAISQADLAVVVGRPGISGIHRLVGILDELLAGPLDPSRALLVVNQAPRRPRERAEITQAIAGLLRGTAADGLPGPLFVPHRSIEAVLRDGGRLPTVLTKSLCSGVKARLAPVLANPTTTPASDVPVPVRPGQFGPPTSGGGR